MKYRLKIRSLGPRSLGVTLPSDLLRKMDWSKYTELTAEIDRDRLVVTKRDHDFEKAVEVARTVIRRYPRAMKRLADE